MNFAVYFSVLFLAAAVSAGPRRHVVPECALKCSGNDKFSYEKDLEYAYLYEAETSTKLLDDEEASESAETKVSALVNIRAVSDCDYVLSLTDVKLSNNDKSSIFSKAVSGNSLMFSFENGVIDHVCSSKEETWVTNFKKGILSHFQNTMQNLKQKETVIETDISGQCETTYIPQVVQDRIIITRKKSPSECTKKYDNNLNIFGFNSDFLVKGLKPIKSNQFCKQTIQNGRISEVSCSEEHAFNPLKKGSGAITISESKLSLLYVESTKHLVVSSFEQRSNLEFVNSETKNNQYNSNDAKRLLNSLMEASENGLKSEVSVLFSEFVSSLRHLTFTEMEQMLSDNEGRVLMFIRDALPLVETDASIQTFVSLILQGKISKTQVDSWFMSLALIRNPTLEMISGLSPLSQNEDSRSMLIISSMIHKYCSKHENCEDKQEIQEFVTNVESILGSGCRSFDDKETENILTALKAIGNMGIIVNSESVLQECSLESNHLKIRVAAIDAWRRMSCDKSRDHFITIFEEPEHENEVRIASYQTIMKCPTQSSLNVVKDRLTSESVNDVTTYIFTHLSNSQKSDEHYNMAKEITEEELLFNKFSSNSLKFSKNFKKSLNVKENLGGTFESNVIFSGNSFIPRSSNLNFDINLFGENINLFEIGLRVENFEAYIEQFFGPNGYYPEETLAAIIKNLRSKSQDNQNAIENIVPTNIDPENMLSLKMFGNEVFFTNMNSLNSVMSEFGYQSVVDMLKDFIQKSNLDLVKNYDLLRSELIHPTISGFPITLTLNGSIHFALNLNKNIDRSFRNIHVKINPSMNVRIESQMAVDQFVSKSGLKMFSNMRSSTNMEGKVIMGRDDIDVEIKMPEENSEIYSITSEVFKIQNDKIDLIHGAPVYEICTGLLERVSKLQLCHQRTVSFRYPDTCLFRSYTNRLYFRKTNPSASAFIGQARFNRHSKQLSFEIQGVPESRYEVTYNNDKDETRSRGQHSLTLRTPYSSSEASLDYENNSGIQKIEASLKMNEIKYLVKIGKEFRWRDDTFEAYLHVASDNYVTKTDFVKITGKMTGGTFKSSDLNIKAESIYFKPISLSCSSQGDRMKFNFESPLFDLVALGSGNLYKDGQLNLYGKYARHIPGKPTVVREISPVLTFKRGNRMYTQTISIKELNFNAKLTEKHGSLTKGSTELTGNYHDIKWYYINEINVYSSKYGYSETPGVNREDTYTMEITKGDSKIYSKNYSIESMSDGSIRFKYESEANVFDRQFKVSVVPFGSNANADRAISAQYNRKYEDGESDVYDVLWSAHSDSSSKMDSKLNLNMNGNHRFVSLSKSDSTYELESDILVKTNVKIDGKLKIYRGTPIKEYLAEMGNVDVLINTINQEQKVVFHASLSGTGFKTSLRSSSNCEIELNGKWNLEDEKFTARFDLKSSFAGWEAQYVDINLAYNYYTYLYGLKLVSFQYGNSDKISLRVNGSGSQEMPHWAVVFNNEFNTATNFRFDVTVPRFSYNEKEVQVDWVYNLCNGSINLSHRYFDVRGKVQVNSVRRGESIISYEHKIEEQNPFVELQVKVPTKQFNIYLFGQCLDNRFNGKAIVNVPNLPQISFYSKPIDEQTHKSHFNAKHNGFDLDIDLDLKNYVLDIGQMEFVFTSNLSRPDDVDYENNLIKVSGSLKENDVDFSFESSKMLDNLMINTTVNRRKRSIDLQMMNDHHHGGIVASFNSFKFVGKTPYSKAKDVYLEVKREPNSFTFDYKRNNNNVFMNLNVESNSKDATVKIDSEIPGWEFLALAGRIDAAEAILYLKGQKASDKLKITGNGQLGKKTGSLTITTTSAYKNYEKVITKIEYNALRNIFSFESKSTSSDYKVLLQIKKGLIFDVLVPNEAANTVVKGKLTPFKGELICTSRFTFAKTFTIKYQINLGLKISATFLLERNGLKIIELDFMRDSEKNMAHLEIHGRRGTNHSHLHFHREGYTNMEFSFKRNGKEFIVKLEGTGNLPSKGAMAVDITNSFRAETRTIKGKVTVDRTVAPKQIVADVDLNGKYNYIGKLKYNGNLKDKRKGDYIFTLEQDRREPRIYDNISGSWDFTNPEDAHMHFKIGSREYKAHGKFGLRDSNFVVESEHFKGKKYIAQWKLFRESNKRNYFIKIGKEDRFVMMKLDGTIKDIFNGDIEAAFRASRFMKNDFEFTAKWKRSASGVSGNGKFNCGDYSGTHQLITLKRNYQDRGMKVNWVAKTNIKNFKNIKLIGEYNLAKKFVDLKLSWDADEMSLKGNLDNFTYTQSNNNINFRIPNIGSGEIEISHDFNNPLDKSITLLGKVGSKKIEYKIHWTRNEDLTKLDLNANIHSGIFGDAVIKADFDIQDMSNAKAHLSYKRNDDKFINIDWTRVKDSKSLKANLMLTSHFKFLPTLKIYLETNWDKEFVLKAGVVHKRTLEIVVKVNKKRASLSLNTPYEEFKEISAKSTYDLSDKKSHITFEYIRGDKIIKGDIDVIKNAPNDGMISLKFSSPFEKVKNLDIKGELKNGEFVAVYKRNDVEVNVKGTATLKTGNSSFNVAFTLPSGKNIEVDLEYDLINFIKGTSSTPKTILHNKIKIEDDHFEVTIKGYRTSEKVFAEIDGTKSFGKIKTFYIKLDSELNLSKREGQLIAKLNDFHLNMKNSFERLPNGYYARSHITSTLTDLPGLTIGLGRDGKSFIVTVGYDEGKEISFTLKGNNKFKNGFSGTIDIPSRKIQDLEYNVNYNFPTEDELKINLKVNLENGEHIEGEIHYNSDGVKSRLTSG